MLETIELSSTSVFDIVILSFSACLLDIFGVYCATKACGTSWEGDVELLGVRAIAADWLDSDGRKMFEGIYR